MATAALAPVAGNDSCLLCTNWGETDFGTGNLYTRTSPFDALQTVEFASLIGSGACTMALGHPTMCNGANLCYEKRVFTEVGGFAGVDHLASGDDEFLMHKIAARHPTGVQFLKRRRPLSGPGRISHGGHFITSANAGPANGGRMPAIGPSLLAVFVFLSNAAPVVALVGWLGSDF